MLDLHREKTTLVTQEYFKRLEKATLQIRAPPSSWLGVVAHRVRATARPSPPMRSNLMDPASTIFEE